jgi:alpha-L-fucosidase
MKYIVLTTRHHEGFSLYDTCGLNDYDAPHSPAGRDLIKEYVDACNEEGVVPFFYHTTLDWYNDDFNNDFSVYLEYLRKSVEILCKNYGKIGGLWFDGNWSKPKEDWKESELYETIRTYQPEAIIINNTGIGNLGRTGHPEIDSVTFEQGRPTPMDRRGMSKYLAAEMCQTINGHWGIGDKDFSYKSVAELIETLCACRKVGANYLLNIGPTAQGGIDPLQSATLEKLGDWVKNYEHMIRQAKPCGIKGQNNDFALITEDGKLYFLIHALKIAGHGNVTVSFGGAGPRAFSGVNKKISRIRWLDNNEELSFAQNGNMFVFNATGFPYGTNLVVRVAEAEFTQE